MLSGGQLRQSSVTWQLLSAYRWAQVHFAFSPGPIPRGLALCQR